MNNKEHIKNLIKQIPELPGIYKMLDSSRNIIYIGKSKCLKKRVQSYFTASPKWEKVTRMVTMIRDIEYIVTDTHLEARLLECNLIKELQPRFNAQMKNDQRYIYIKIEPYNPFHPLSVVSEREADCIGPFRSKYSITQFIGSLKNLYPIRKCGSQFEFEYQLFPVKMEKELFEQNRNVLLDLFSETGNIQSLIDTLQLKLEEVVSDYRFEMAAIYRDMIQGFTIIKNTLDGYKSLSTKNLLLKLPTCEGYKLFYVANCYIINDMATTSLSDKILSDFIKTSAAKLDSFIPIYSDEKSNMDYRDVMYSEISDIPDEMIDILKS